MDPQFILFKDYNKPDWFSRLHGFSALLVVGTIPYPIKVHNVSVILFLLISILTLGPNLREFYKFCKTPLLLILKVLILLLGLIFVADLNNGYEDIERELYLLAAILMVYFMRLKKISSSELCWAFSIATIMLMLYGFFVSWIYLSRTDFLLMLQEGHTSYSTFVGISQPLYLAVYLLFICLFIVGEIQNSLPKLSYSRGLLLLILIVLATSQILFLRSKATLLLLPLFLIVYVVAILKKRGWWVAFALLGVTLLTLLLDKDGLPEIVNNYGRNVSQAFDQRLIIWRGAIEGIEQKPLFGSGTGNTQELLNAGYAKIGYREGIDNQFNAHNQYLQFMARNGLPELLCFLAILGYSFWRSTKQSNYTFLMFNILVSLVMLTESFLSVQKGIVFFYFFLLAFIYLPEKKQEASQI